MFTNAITRKPGKDFASGITTSQLGRPDYLLMLAQHQDYMDTLRSIGLKVDVLEDLPGFPDAFFVEDVAVVFPEAAVITRPGALARRGEEERMEPVLARYRSLFFIEAPGTLDGGDVLMVDKHFFVGISERTNAEGAAQLGKILTQYGYSWTPVPVEKGLHFKSDVNYVGEDTLLVTERFINRGELDGYKKILVEPGEEYAANTLLVNDCLLTPMGFPVTAEKLQELGLHIIELDVSEARKMDGGLTCMSLRF